MKKSLVQGNYQNQLFTDVTLGLLSYSTSELDFQIIHSDFEMELLHFK